MSHQRFLHFGVWWCKLQVVQKFDVHLNMTWHHSWTNEHLTIIDILGEIRKTFKCPAKYMKSFIRVDKKFLLLKCVCSTYINKIFFKGYLINILTYYKIVTIHNIQLHRLVWDNLHQKIKGEKHQHQESFLSQEQFFLKEVFLNCVISLFP